MSFMPWIEVKGFDPSQYFPAKQARRMDHFTQYAVAAALMAVKDSGLEITPELAPEVGVLIGCGLGGLNVIEEQHKKLLAGGPGKVSPFFIPGALINLCSGQVSIRYGFKGPNHAVVTACSTGAHAIGDGMRLIKYGDADVMIAGGSEAAICEIGRLLPG